MSSSWMVVLDDAPPGQLGLKPAIATAPEEAGFVAEPGRTNRQTALVRLASFVERARVHTCNPACPWLTEL